MKAKPKRASEFLPLSPLQEGLLFRAEFEADGVDPHVLQLVADLVGPLDAVALRTASAGLLRRHATLRACFRRRRNGQPVQVVPADVAPIVAEVDLSGLPDDELAAELARITDADRVARFDLAQPPLVRATVIRTGPDQYRLLWTVHHILLDGWSLAIVVRELLALYVSGADPDALTPIRPYSDYLALLRDRDVPAAEAAWRATLADVTDPTRVAENVGPPTVPATVAVELSEELTTRIGMRARAGGSTLNSVLRVCWAMLLAGLTGQRDILFGAVDSGRPPDLDGVESMVGLFANTLPVRVVLDPAASLADTVAAVRDQQVDLLSHQHIGLADVQRLAGVGELFDTIMTFQSYPMAGAGVAKIGDRLRVTSSEVRAATGYPLSLTVLPGDRMTLLVQYTPDVFTPEQADAIADRLHRLLAAYATDPNVAVGRVDALSPEDRELVLDTWNDTGRDFGSASVPAMLAAQALRTPDSIAVRCGAETLTYRDLYARVRLLTDALLARGAGAERLIAIALPRGIDLVVAAIAVLSSGAAYLPIDPHHPVDRISAMASDAAPVLVLSDSATSAKLAETSLAGTPTLLLDDPAVLADAVGREPVESIEDSPAYVIYTSGSTGKPKGVVVPRNALANILLDMCDRFGLDESDRLVSATTFGFDISNAELFMPLLVGAELVMADDDVATDAAALAELIGTSRATVVQATPSRWQSLIAVGADLSAVRVITGGEALPEPLAEALIAGAREVYNVYGPTEATIWCTATELTADRIGVSLGGPMANYTHYVLDAALRPVPPGLPGELYVGGVGVARGYLNRFDLTSTRFVANPFGGPGTRMYRTGDIVRWRSDGGLEFLGRTDHQVKVRGFRIELGEIESVLSAHQDVQRAAVVAREYGPADVRLIGYVVPADPAAPPDRATLAAHLSAALPEYMVPGTIMVLDRFPMTPSGKTDRNALPEPDLAVADTQQSEAPAEQLLCGLFADVLRLPSVGVHDDFFHLGGHSLLGTALVSRVRAVFGVELPVRELFRAPTPAGLARVIAAADGPRPALRLGVLPDVVPLSPAQIRLWFVNRLGAAHGVYHVPLAIRLSGELDVAAVRQAFTDVVARHDAMRTVFPAVDGEPRQQVLEIDGVELPVSDVAPADLPGRLAAETVRDFDLADGLAVRARLFRLAPTEHVLLVVAHHIVADGWSAVPLMRDFGTAYRARLAGVEPNWAPLPVRYADYTMWHRDQVLGSPADPDSELNRQLDYWRTALADLPPELALPTDHPRSPITTHRGGSVAFAVPPELHRDLVALARKADSTLFMVCQAALTTLLAKLTGATDIPLATAIAGRTDNALADMVGLFVNTLVLRVDASGDPTFAELVRRARETDLAAYAHQDVPYERVVQALNPDRSLAREALFQVALVFGNYRQPEFDLPGITAAVEPIVGTSAKCDLHFQFDEHTDNGAPSGLDGWLEYSTDLFTHATAESIAGRLLTVLRAVVTEVDTRISGLNLLSEQETNLVTRVWAGPTATPVGDTLPGMFDRYVLHTPDAIAVVCDGAELTYRDIDARANRLARVLVRRGVGPEAFVALALPRTPDFVVAVLAVLKAGAAFLPIDPTLPQDRIDYVLADARPVCGIAVPETSAGLHAAGLPVVSPNDTDATTGLATDLTDTDRTAPLSPDHPAYVIYTSGSTGRPKGVVIPHSAAAGLGHAMAAYVGTGRPVRMLQFASPIFDAVVWELCGSVFTGGALVLLADADRTGARLADAITRAAVTHTVLPQVVLGTMPADRDLPTDLVLAVAGEACPPEVAARWSAGRMLLNLYGPTETAVWATVSDPLSGAARPPIGRPVTGHRVAVLDARLRPVPVGVVGELYVAGGLARGYLNRAGLTSERFVADPLGPPGGRIYRTGDLVRWLPDGQLDFVGRSDQQVKLRGFRIELGEIESTIAAHPAVIAATATVRDDTLVAYVITESDSVELARSVREFAEARLPHYMVPSYVVRLTEFPTSPSGKVDRGRLPAPVIDTRDARQPETAVQRILCDVFADVLGISGVGMDIDFFAAGGNSIRSLQVVDRAARAGVLVDVADLFVHRTPAGLATVAEVGGQRVGVDVDPFATVLPIRPTGDLPPLFCVHSGLGLSLPYLGLGEHVDPRRPIYGIQSPHIDTGAPIAGDLADLAVEYVRLVREIQPSGPYHLLGWSFGGLLAHDMAALLAAMGERVDYVAAIDSFPDTATHVATERELLAKFCDNVGFDSAGLSDEVLTRDGVLALLRDRGGIMAAVDAARLPRLLTAMAEYTRLATEFTPARRPGGLDVFVATEGISQREAANRVRRWVPHVAGPIVRHDVPADHDHMLHPAARAAIGRIVGASLARLSQRTYEIQPTREP
ncbi:MAG TPA: amino acid adenylation domain-containing protein [Pseudonocardiaceae bacterium]|nr:amino acid adenylation domain-containing protein [Pseudonocardiaceae bacterium]